MGLGQEQEPDQRLGWLSLGAGGPVLIRSGVSEAMGFRTWRKPEKSPKLSPCHLAKMCKVWGFVICLFVFKVILLCLNQF